MKGRRFSRIGALISLGVAVWLFLTALGQADEVRYRGRTFPEWRSALKDRSPEIRAGAAQALGQFGPSAVQVLSASLADPELRVRGAAAEALRSIGPAAVPSLVRALESQDIRVRANATTVLGAIGPAAREAVPALVKATKDPSPRVRELAVGALNRITTEGVGSYTIFALTCH
jgi:HEAT repeat protein